MEAFFTAQDKKNSIFLHQKGHWVWGFLQPIRKDLSSLSLRSIAVIRSTVCAAPTPTPPHCLHSTRRTRCSLFSEHPGAFHCTANKRVLLLTYMVGPYLTFHSVYSSHLLFFHSPFSPQHQPHHTLFLKCDILSPI